MEIKGPQYQVTYSPNPVMITCQGSFRLRGSEYAPITQLLNETADAKPETITLNLKSLKFLNSSGINMFSKFVIRVRKQKTTHIIVQGSREFPWQRKSLKNLRRLMPTLKLELE
jgi:hypothetical protein